MDLLRLWLIIHIVSVCQVSTTNYHVRVQGYSGNREPFLHCKYFKYRLPYYRNSSATFQLNLLKAGDVAPNPGPTAEYSHLSCRTPIHSTSYNRLGTGERIVYNREILLLCNPAWRHLSLETVTNDFPNFLHRTGKNRGMLNENVWRRIKELGVQTHLRGKRWGRRKNVKTRTRVSTILSAPSLSHIPVITSSCRKLTYKKLRGMNVDNLKVVPNLSNSFVESNCNVCLWNAHSVRNKTICIAEYVHEHDFDIMFITETWLNPQDDVIIGELTPRGSSFINSPRNTSTRGGGIGVLYKSTLKLMMKNSVLSFSTFEWAHITDLSCSVNFFIVYRPPPSSVNRLTSSKFLNEFDEFVSEISLYPGKLVLLGDFNIHWEDMSKSDVLHMNNSTASAGLIQHVQGPTHNLGHTLDLVFTRDDLVISDCNTFETCISDHHMIRFSLAKQKSELISITSSLRNYRKIDKVQFANALQELVSSQPAGLDSESLFDWYVSGVTKVLDTYARYLNF